MSSDKKVLISLRRTKASKSFNKKLKEVRKQFGIPINGFNSLKKGFYWLWDMETWIGDMFKENNLGYKKFKAYEKASKELVAEFSIPPSLAPLLNELIVYSDKILNELIPARIYGCTLIETSHQNELFDIEEYWRHSGTNYVTLLIHEGTSKDDIKEYLKYKWNEIQKIIKGKRIRENKQLKRDKKVFSYLEKGGKELGVKNGLTKESRVKEILEKQHGIYMSEGNIKRIGTEQRKLKR